MLYSLTPDHYISNISPLDQHISGKEDGGGGEIEEKMWRMGCYINSKIQIIANQILFTAQLLDKLRLMPFAMGQGTA